MLIFRYLAKEVLSTLVALTVILLLIFMCNQFIIYLNRAANGQIPAVLLLKLMMLELPTMLGLLLPLGFYVALLVAYGRLYAESEMTVLRACGYGPWQLMKHTLTISSFVALLVLVIMLWASPLVAIERAKLLRATGIQTMIQLIVPGRFHAASGGHVVYFVGSMNRAHTRASHVFLARLVPKQGQEQWQVMSADSAYAETDPETNEDFLVLKDGKAYEGQPGRADYQVAEFEQYQARLPHPSLEIVGDIRTHSTSSLWSIKTPNLNQAAELQWRFSIPLMVLVLSLAAVPLSRVNPRAGKYAKLLPALIFFMIYANFMFVARGWFVSGKSPMVFGIWWIHGVAALVGLWLIWRNHVKLS